MKDNDINIEDRILDSAYKTFLLFGYHGTTLQQISMKAGVNKSTVHYYYRSKGRLYTIVVKKVLELYFNTRDEPNATHKELEKPIWFLISELYNNKYLFEDSLKKIYPDNWDVKMYNLLNWLKFSDIRCYCILE